MAKRERLAATVSGEFFGEAKATVTPKTPKKKERVYDCTTCCLDKECLTPRMPYSGNGKRGILILAEAPGATEDKVGEPLVGDAGNLLRRECDELGIDLDEDCWKTNAVVCRPPNNRTPTDLELRCCRPRWQSLMRELQPRFVWLLGNSAVDSYFSGRFEGKYVQLSKWRRYCIPDHLYNAWVCCMYHPSYALRAGKRSKYKPVAADGDTSDSSSVPDKDGIIPTIFRKDLRWAITCLRREPPKRDILDRRVRVLTEYDLIVQQISRLKNCTLVFDYETTSTKPYREGNRILTVGFKVLGENRAYAFPFQWPLFWSVEQQYVLEERWKAVMRDPSVKKVAHSMKFEDVWTRVILKTPVENWYTDTQLRAHTLDVREKVSGLKVQAFVRYGEVYDQVVKPYMEDTDENGFNRLVECPLPEVLRYNGLDCHFEERLLIDTEPFFQNPDSASAKMLQLFHRGALAFSDIEIEGIGSDIKYFEKSKERLEGEVEALHTELLHSPEAEKFKEVTGRQIDLKAATDMGMLFYEILGEKVARITPKTKKPSLDAESLETFQSEFARKMVRMKRIRDKWITTYLKNFMRETWAGKIHPSYSFNPETGRSSSDHPNFQNIPKRDKEGMMLIRTGIVPERGFELGSADYKQIEVSIQACLSRDAKLIEYCRRTDADMHTDQSMRLFFLDHEWAKLFRGIAKNDFVFPQIYGDWYKANAEYIWKDIRGKELPNGMLLVDHLKECGIENLEDYMEHVRLVEKDFWQEFHETAAWRDEQVELYKRNLYVESPFGFRRNGHLRRNQICNTPVQSSAFHCLLWSLIELNDMRKREGWRSKIVGQIHDQIVFMVHPSEKKALIEKVTDVMCEKIKEDKPWIIVPLRVDFEFSGINKPWAYKEEDD